MGQVFFVIGMQMKSGNGSVSVQSSNAQEERNCRAKVLGIGVA